MPPQNENLAPRDAKVISLIIRSLGIEECEPKVITQLLELSYKYATDVLIDARKYAEHCERTSIGVNDIKLSLQSKVGKYFVPPPPRQYLLDIANVVNAKPLSVSEGENLVRVPGRNIFNLNYDYEIIEKGKEKENVLKGIKFLIINGSSRLSYYGLCLKGIFIFNFFNMHKLNFSPLPPTLPY